MPGHAAALPGQLCLASVTAPRGLSPAGSAPGLLRTQTAPLQRAEAEHSAPRRELRMSLGIVTGDCHRARWPCRRSGLAKDLSLSPSCSADATTRGSVCI